MVLIPGTPPVGRELRTVARRADDRTGHGNDHAVALTQAERTGIIRAGWNDAAWGRPPRALPGRLARLYELGYTGGLVFRRKRRLADLLGPPPRA
jgi:hypothetical protein